MRHSEGRPVEVRKAMLRGDHKALSNMGKKGAEAAAATRVLKEVEKNDHKAQEAMDAEAAERALNIDSDGNVLPPDEAIFKDKDIEVKKH